MPAPRPGRGRGSRDVDDGALVPGGGTNLVDLMKLGAPRPTMLVDVGGLGLDAIEELDGGGLRIGAAARNSDVAGHRAVRRDHPLLALALLAGASGQVRNMATVAGNLLQRTRCAYFQDVTKPCNKRAPGSGCPARNGDHRNLSVLGGSDACIANHPSDMAVALAALDATSWSNRVGRAADGDRRLYRLPGDDPSRDTVLEPRLVDRSGRGATAADRGRGRRTARCATGPRSPSGSASVAPCSSWTTARSADVRLALGAIAPKPWRGPRAEAALRGGGHQRRDLHRGGRRRARGGDSAAGQRLQGHARTPAGASARCWRWRRDERHRAPSRGTHRPHPRPGRRARKGDGRGPLRLRAHAGDVAYGVLVHVDDRQGSRRRRRRHARPGAARGRWPSSRHANAPRLPRPRRRRTGRPAVPRTSPTTARSSPSSWRRLSRRRRGRRAGDRRLRAAVHDVDAAHAITRGCTPRKDVNPDFDTDTDRRRRRRARRGAGRGRRRPTRRPTSTTTRWSRTPRSPGGTASGSPSTTRCKAPPGRGSGSRPRSASTKRTSTSCIPYVGGGFGSKGMARPHAVVAALAARVVERPVKLAVTRQQMFAITGYRTPTIQRLRLGASGRRDAQRHRPRCLGADLHAARVRRADRRRHPAPLCRTEPPHLPSPGRPRRAHAELDARPRRDARRVRP